MKDQYWLTVAKTYIITNQKKNKAKQKANTCIGHCEVIDRALIYVNDNVNMNIRIDNFSFNHVSTFARINSQSHWTKTRVAWIQLR